MSQWRRTSQSHSIPSRSYIERLEVAPMDNSGSGPGNPMGEDMNMSPQPGGSMGNMGNMRGMGNPGAGSGTRGMNMNSSGNMGDGMGGIGNLMTDGANKLGSMKGTGPMPDEVNLLLLMFTLFVLICKQNASMLSSAGGIGKHFNPNGSIGQMGQKIGGPMSKDGMIGRQFDASKDGLAGHVERAVDGPRNPSGSGSTK
jgi:hypothetical protein